MPQNGHRKSRSCVAVSPRPEARGAGAGRSTFGRPGADDRLRGLAAPSRGATLGVASLERVFEHVVQFVVAPLLVGAASVAARRWGHRIGGLVSAFPAIVGPVLLIGAERHGASFVAQEATGVLLGLAALSGFALAYGWTAPHTSWPGSLTVGWALAAVTAGVAGGVGANLLGALATAVASLGVAQLGLPRARVPEFWLEPPRGDIALRMALTSCSSSRSRPWRDGWARPPAGSSRPCRCLPASSRRSRTSATAQQLPRNSSAAC
jgi:hypothetical protein